jgi:FAD/FMN-containing dehydrogenase
MDPYAMVGQYINFLGHDETDARQKALQAYGPAKLDRLVALKRRYDPDGRLPDLYDTCGRGRATAASRTA